MFAIGVIFDSGKLRLDALKTDPVMMLLHGLDSPTSNDLKASLAKGKDVGGILVRLSDSPERLQLSRTDS